MKILDPELLIYPLFEGLVLILEADELYNHSAPEFVQSKSSLDPLKRAQLERKIQEIALKAGVKKKIDLLTDSGQFSRGIAVAYGSGALKGKAAIVIDINFAKLPLDLIEFILAHEVAHIKNNDFLNEGKLRLVAGSIARTVGYLVFHFTGRLFFKNFPPLPAFVMMTSVIVSNLFTKVISIFQIKGQEEAADRLGFSLSSKEGQKFSYFIFESFVDVNLKYRNEKNLTFFESLKRKIKYTSEGNYRLDFDHPPLTKRVAYLKELAGVKTPPLLPAAAPAA